MKNLSPFFSHLLISFLFIIVAQPVQGCDHSSLQLDTYLEFPIAHDGIVNCQHLDFGERGELVLIGLNTPQGDDLITSIIFLLQGQELIAKHQISSFDKEDVVLEDGSRLPAFSYYSSSVGWMQYFIYQDAKGFVPTIKMDQTEMKAVNFFDETYYDYLSYHKIQINTFVGLDTEIDEILFLLGAADSTSIRSSFDIGDSSIQVLHYDNFTISLEDGLIWEFTLANEGDELAQIVVGSDDADLVERFPHSFGERLVTEDDYRLTLALLNAQHQVGDYRYLSKEVKAGIISKISLWINP
ncbi:MAG: hypothetical protein AB8H47_17345 [Bacteroidia bacterium]